MAGKRDARNIRKSLIEVLRIFRACWAHSLALMVIGLGATLVVALLVVVAAVAVATTFHGQPTTLSSQILVGLEVATPTILALAAVMAVIAAALINGANDAQLGRSLSLRRSLQVGVGRAPATFRAGVIAVVAIAVLLIAAPLISVLGIVGLILTPVVGLVRRSRSIRWPSVTNLVVAAIPFAPAIVLSVRWVLFLPAVALEPLGARDALRRSSDLVQQRWVDVVGVLVVVNVLFGVPQLVAGLLINDRDLGNLVNAAIQLFLLALPIAALAVLFVVANGGEAQTSATDGHGPGGPRLLSGALSLLVVFAMATSAFVLSAPLASASEKAAEPITSPVSSATFGAGASPSRAQLDTSGVIRGSVFEDSNGNGVFDSDESGLPDWANPGVTNVLLALESDPGVDLQNIQLGAGGSWEFTGLNPSASYVVKIWSDTDWYLSPKGQDPDSPSNNSVFDPDSLQTDAIVPQEQPDAVQRAGLIARSWQDPIFGQAIGGFVLHDLDLDGSRSRSEGPLGDVVVSLYTAAGTLIESTTTFGVNGDLINGAYYFGSAEAKAALNGAGAFIEFTPPSGWALSPNLGDASHVDPTSGRSSIVTFGAQDRISINAGMYREASIEGVVWEDANFDGARGAGEQGRPDVRVELRNDFSDSVLMVAQTDSGGNYRFDGLIRGDHTVTFVRPVDRNFSKRQAAGSVSYDTENVVSLDIGEGEQRQGVDAGLVRSGTIGGEVWNDTNENGLRDLDESPLAQVRVQLFDRHGGYLTDTETVQDGTFAFAGLFPDVYQITVMRPTVDWEFSQDPNAETQLVISRVDLLGRSGIIDMTNAPDGSIRGNFGNINAGIYLVPTAPPTTTIPPTTTTTAPSTTTTTAPTVTTSTTTAPTTTAPSTTTTTTAPTVTTPALSTISGKVFDDIDNDSVRSANDLPVAGWLVTLTDGPTVVDQTRSSADGSYRFSQLAPGTYTVTLEEKASYRSSGENPVTQTVGADQQSATIDFLVWRAPTLRVLAFIDNDSDGIRDIGETTVRLPVPIDIGRSGNSVWDGSVGQRQLVLPGLSPGEYRLDVLPGPYTVSTSNPVEFTMVAGVDTRIEIGIVPGLCHRLTATAVGDGDVEVFPSDEAVACVGPNGPGFTTGSVLTIRSSLRGTYGGTYLDNVSTFYRGVKTSDSGADDQTAPGFHNDYVFTVGNDDAWVVSTFKRCVGLQFAASGPGAISVATAPDCPKVSVGQMLGDSSPHNDSRRAGMALFRADTTVLLEALGETDSARLETWGPNTPKSCDRSGSVAAIGERGRKSYLPVGCKSGWFADSEFQGNTVDPAEQAESYLTVRLTDTVSLYPFFFDSSSCQVVVDVRAAQPIDVVSGGVTFARFEGPNQGACQQSIDPWNPSVDTSFRAGDGVLKFGVETIKSPIAGWTWEIECVDGGPSCSPAQGSQWGTSLELDVRSHVSLVRKDSQALVTVQPVYCFAVLPRTVFEDRDTDWRDESPTMFDIDGEQNPFIHPRSSPEGNCPFTVPDGQPGAGLNAWTVGTNPRFATSPELPYFRRTKLLFDEDGTKPVVEVTASFSFECVKLVNPYASLRTEVPQVQVNLAPNCPSLDPSENHYLAGTTVYLTAIENGTVFTSWAGNDVDFVGRQALDNKMLLGWDYTQPGVLSRSIAVDYYVPDFWDDVASVLKNVAGVVLVAMPIAVAVLAFLPPLGTAIATSIAVMGAIATAGGFIASATGDQTAKDIFSTASILSGNGAKCGAAWALSDVTEPRENADLLSSETDRVVVQGVGTARSLALTAQGLRAKGFDAETAATRKSNKFGLLTATVEVGFNLRDIEEEYGFGSERTAEAAWTDGRRFQDCMASGDQNSIWNTV